MNITIAQESPRTPEARELLTALDDAMAGPYTPDQHHALSLADLEQENVRFFLARLNEQPVGCAGVALYSDYAEVKRLFTVPSARGTGVASALIGQIEAEAAGSGATVLRLETGVYQSEAIGLYDRLGFRRCGAFGPYARKPAQAIEKSLFYEKPLYSKSR